MELLRSDAGPGTDSRPRGNLRGMWVLLLVGATVLPCGDVPEDMACVPGGDFIRGKDADPAKTKRRGRNKKKRVNAWPAEKVWVQTFYIDRHEVTYEQFETCIEAKACDVRPEDGRWGPRYTDFSRPKQPITGVNWYQARQYCRSQGKDLPTEAQWEKAARGPDGELYPWGNDPVSCKVAVYKSSKGRSCGVKKRGSTETGRVLEIGSRPPGRYGVYDLIGNVEEWVLDWYSNSYEACGEACAGKDPKGPCDGADACPGHDQRIVRGGSWYYDETHATSWHRRPHYPDNRPPDRYHHFGFRCASEPRETE